MACDVYTTIHFLPVSIDVIKKKVAYILAKEKKSTVRISIHIVGDSTMKRLNKTYRNISKTTDVLSFAMRDAVFFPGEAKENESGDIFISLPQIKRQALEHGISVKQEFLRMLVHGILHILGYGHDTPRLAKQMFAKQEKLVTLCL